MNKHLIRIFKIVIYNFTLSYVFFKGLTLKISLSLDRESLFKVVQLAASAASLEVVILHSSNVQLLLRGLCSLHLPFQSLTHWVVHYLPPAARCLAAVAAAPYGRADWLLQAGSIKSRKLAPILLMINVTTTIE